LPNKPWTLEAGRQRLSSPSKPDADGFTRYTAEVEVAHDTRTKTTKPPRW
jgi:hypothetical protein